MKIRAKLIFLVLGILVFLGAAGTFYFVLLAPVTEMENEKSYLLRLESSVKDQMIQLNRLSFAPIKDTGESFVATSAAVSEAFTDLEKIKLLPRINADVMDAFDIIMSLRELNETRLATLNDSYAVLRKDADALFFSREIETKGFDLLYVNHFTPEKKKILPAALEHLSTIKSCIETMNDSLATSISTIDQQYSLIDGEISAARGRALRTVILVAACIVGLTIVASLLFAGSIARSIINIEKFIFLIKGGDLTQRATVRTRDEIGKLADNLNLFLDSISSSILGIKEVSKANIETKNKLGSAGNDAMSATTQIQASASSIGSQMGVLDSRVEDSAGSIEKISASIASLNNQIESESAMVEEATASVTEMLSSLENMSRITEKDRLASEELVVEASRGRAVFESAFERIREIPRSVGTIREMAELIQGIASQTNLLGMNAAIEAAHAGKSGRGFAVVADEIRKLSEASTKSSGDISASIESIVRTIEDATSANVETTGAFAAIDVKIREVSKSMTEIHASISEIRTGSEQILSAMVDLQERSLRVKEGSKAMDEGSREIKAMMADLVNISSEATSNISEITAGISEIGSTIRRVMDFSEEVAQGSLRLDIEVNRFRTADFGQAGPLTPASEAS
jgi:methyl-accepting chemotaxis protein